MISVQVIIYIFTCVERHACAVTPGLVTLRCIRHPYFVCSGDLWVWRWWAITGLLEQRVLCTTAQLLSSYPLLVWKRTMVTDMVQVHPRRNTQVVSTTATKPSCVVWWPPHVAKLDNAHLHWCIWIGQPFHITKVRQLTQNVLKK